MKTCKQNAQEIFCEIERRKKANAAVKKRAVKAFTLTLAVGLLLPATVYFSATATHDKNQPLSFDLPSETTEESEREDATVLPHKT